MALGIYLGGITGSAGGSLEVPGDGSGLTLGAIGSVGTLHIRAASGKQNAEQVTVNAPANCEVSADGITYAATAVYAIGAIQDVNVAIYVKRTAGTNALTTGGTTTPRLSLITEEAIPVPDTTAPVLSGTLSAVAGDGQVTLSGPTATDAVGIAKWQYRIAAGAWVDIAASNSTTMPSTVVGSLTNGTEYSFTVRALDAAANASDASGAATATPEAADVTAPALSGTLVATAGDGQAVLDWPDATDAVGVTGYDVEYGTSTAYGSTITDPTASTATITGLTNGTPYYFRVRAHDAAGNVSDWLTASATPFAVAPAAVKVVRGTDMPTFSKALPTGNIDDEVSIYVKLQDVGTDVRFVVQDYVGGKYAYINNDTASGKWRAASSDGAGPVGTVSDIPVTTAWTKLSIVPNGGLFVDDVRIGTVSATSANGADGVAVWGMTNGKTFWVDTVYQGAVRVDNFNSESAWSADWGVTPGTGTITRDTTVYHD